MKDAREDSSGPDPVVPPAVWTGLVDRLAAENGWRGGLRALATPTRVLVAGSILAAVALAVGMALRRPDFAVYPIFRFVVLAAALVVAAILAAAAFLRPLHRRRPSPRAWRAVLLGVLALPVVMAALPAPHAELEAYPASGADQGRFLLTAAHCLLMGSLFALPLLSGLLLLDRRDHLAAGRGLLLAAAAAILGNLALLLYCPIVSNSHRMAGHAAVVLILAAITGLFAARCNRGRPAP